MTEEHLGGHAGKTCIDQPLFAEIANNYKIKSMIDIGCGPGGMHKIAKQHNVFWYGIDGDSSVIENSPTTVLHDFTKGSPKIIQKFDLAWSVEFLEHVEESFIENYMTVFSLAKFVNCTAAPPGATGHHHVNCKDLDYWIDVFKQYGFTYDSKYTEKLKSISKMRKGFYKRSGMFFYK